jgi:hypothetical protein
MLARKKRRADDGEFHFLSRCFLTVRVCCLLHAPLISIPIAFGSLKEMKKGKLTFWLSIFVRAPVRRFAVGGDKDYEYGFAWICPVASIRPSWILQRVDLAQGRRSCVHLFIQSLPLVLCSARHLGRCAFRRTVVLQKERLPRYAFARKGRGFGSVPSFVHRRKQYLPVAFAAWMLILGRI